MSTGDCSICFDALDSSDIVTDCHHCFHRVCIRTWLHNHSTCPLCRYSLTNVRSDKQEDDYEIFEVSIIDDVVMFTPLDEPDDVPMNDSPEDYYEQSDEELIHESDDEDYVPSDEESEYSD